MQTPFLKTLPRRLKSSSLPPLTPTKTGADAEPGRRPPPWGSFVSNWTYSQCGYVLPAEPQGVYTVSRPDSGGGLFGGSAPEVVLAGSSFFLAAVWLRLFSRRLAERSPKRFGRRGAGPTSRCKAICSTARIKTAPASSSGSFRPLPERFPSRRNAKSWAAYTVAAPRPPRALATPALPAAYR